MPRFVVVAADDAGGLLLLGEFELFLVEFGMEEQVEGKSEDLVGIAFEGIPGERGGVVVASGFNVGCFGFKQVVEGVSVDFGGAAGAPCLAVEADEAGFGGVFIAGAAGNEDGAGDERELMVFLEEDDNAVLELDAFGLLRLEVVKLGDGDFLPGLVLLGGKGDGGEEGGEAGDGEDGFGDANSLGG